MRFNKQVGFTLVEVMVAMMIVGLALPALLDQAESLSRHTFNARAKTQAYWVAQNKVAELKIDQRLNGSLPPRKESRTVELGRDKWQWTVITEETEIENVLRLEVQVARAEQEGALASLREFIRSD